MIRKKTYKIYCNHHSKNNPNPEGDRQNLSKSGEKDCGVWRWFNEYKILAGVIYNITGGIMRKYVKIIVTLIICSLFLFTGCNKFGSNPKSILSKFLDASLRLNYDEAYKYISSEDKKVKSFNEYKSYQSFDSLPESLPVKTFIDKMTYEIKEVNIEGQKAEANVEITMPDFGAMLSDMLGAAFLSAFEGKSDEEIQKDFANKILEEYKDKNIPMTTTTQKYKLIREEDGWKIYFDWKTQERINELMSQAKQLEEEKNFTKAKEIYEQVIELNSTSFKAIEAAEKIKELEEEIEIFIEKQAYMDKIEVRNVKVDMGETMFLEKKIGVFGEIKNRGDRTLNKVEITIYCLDKNGNPVFEKTFHPVLVSKYLYSSDANESLRPNYSRKFGYSIDDAPSDWSKKVRVEVTDIKFSE